MGVPDFQSVVSTGDLPDIHQLLGDTTCQQNHLQVVLPELPKVRQLEAVGLLHRQSVLVGQGHQARDWLERNEGGRTTRRLGDAVQHLYNRPDLLFSLFA